MAQPSQLKTIYTNPGVTDLLIQPTEYVVVSLVLLSAGPCVVGTDSQLTPLGSGKGVQLTTVPQYFFLSPNIDVLYIYADAVQRVTMAVHPMNAVREIINAIKGNSPLPPAPPGTGVVTGSPKSFRKAVP